MLRLLGRGDSLATSCVNLAEIEAGCVSGSGAKPRRCSGTSASSSRPLRRPTGPAATGPTGRGGAVPSRPLMPSSPAPPALTAPCW